MLSFSRMLQRLGINSRLEKPMDEEQFPKELTETLLPTIKKYQELGFRDIDVGWPTGTNWSTRTVFVHATSPSGQRLHGLFDDNNDLVSRVDLFLGRGLLI